MVVKFESSTTCYVSASCLSEMSIKKHQQCDPNSISSLPKSKNQGIKHEKMPWRCFLKIYAIGLRVIIVATWLTFRRRSWYLQKEHHKLHEVDYLFVETKQNMKETWGKHGLDLQLDCLHPFSKDPFPLPFLCQNLVLPTPQLFGFSKRVTLEGLEKHSLL